MLDFDPPIIITVFDQGRRTWRKGNLDRRPPALLPLETVARRAAHERGEPVVEETPLCRVQAWPIHEPQWKREILRTEWADDIDSGPDAGTDDIWAE